ncbi:NAD dependent epimerase/dehydratase family protein, partial [Yersinia pestis PY-88]
MAGQYSKSYCWQVQILIIYYWCEP